MHSSAVLFLVRGFKDFADFFFEKKKRPNEKLMIRLTEWPQDIAKIGQACWGAGASGRNARVSRPVRCWEHGLITRLISGQRPNLTTPKQRPPNDGH